MKILYITQKGRFMNTMAKYHIYKAKQEGITLNDTHIHNKNPIFETLHKYYQTIHRHSTIPPPQPTVPTPTTNTTLSFNT
jgi:hypothetical protein